MATEITTAENRLQETEGELLRTRDELERKLREAQEANRAKEVFLSSMSHDIRTPMNAIIGMTALAKKHIDEKARVLDALDKIETASAHLLSLINEVLDMSRIDSGRLQISQTSFSLGDLLHDTLVLMKPLAAQKGHFFQLKLGDIPAETLCGDPLRLRQIFVNIISNAIKYTKDAGEITVSVREEIRGEICDLFLDCADNGIGMTADFLARIFDPFERAGTTTSSRVEGTGLGMSIVKKLTDAMDGDIRIESEPGKGTRVYLRIPLRYEETRMDLSALKGKRLLILEGDPELQEAYRKYLAGTGLDFTLVSGFSDGLRSLTAEEYRNSPYHGVVIGTSLSDGSNVFDMAEYLKKSHPSLPLLLISEDNWEEIEYRATRSGIRAFLPVPFFRHSLEECLCRAFLERSGKDALSDTPDLSGKRILLAEDNLINREIACEILSGTRAEIDTAADGEQAVTAYRGKPEGYYDLILMDIQMPVMDGYTAAQQIRGSDRRDSAHIPIYAMTANTFAEDIAKARDAGMNGHIAKPIDINKLMQLLCRLW